MTWAWRTLGNPAFQPIVFLHGFMGKGDDWLEIAEGLSNRFYCLMPDLPGHGETPLDEEPAYAAWASALRKALDERNIARTHLVGYSMGGRIALFFALTYPEMVDKLVLESANPGIIDPVERAQRAELDDKLAARLRKNGMKYFLEFWYDIPLFDSLSYYPALKKQLRIERAKQDIESIATVLSALSPGRQPELWSRLKEIELQTLLIAGRLDKKYTAVTEKALTSISNCQSVILSTSGHNTHQENPAAVQSLLDDWL
ncbi:MAG: 2-succinyl-6-hydroxy-2,4-cyclohexadiene-1-carboxylate synthase [Chloroflexi bacterium]|nr:2-succinyl-6-hydroxy-2,4-cyclohexadiene-1-carboxylate synthase [Chloroflexota bacterium]